MIKIGMFSSATKVKGQGVGSAYTELINLLKKYYSQELNIEINKFNRVNISHYHTIDPQFYLSTFFPGRGCKIGYVHFLPETIDGSLKLPWLAKKVFFKYIISFYKRMDQLVVVNPSFIEKLTAYGIKREKITYIPNFVSSDTFYKISDSKENLRKKLNLDNKFTIVGVGQVQERKGVPDFVKLAKLNPEIQFVWVGGFSFGAITDGYDELKKVIKNPPANLKFPGIVDRDKMNEYYNAADLFLLPSYNELFPMSVLEAFSSGLPVMLRDLDLYYSIIDGYYEPAKDVNDMNRKIINLSQDRKKLEKLEEKSKKAAEYYSERRLAKIWLAYYQKFSR